MQAASEMSTMQSQTVRNAYPAIRTPLHSEIGGILSIFESEVRAGKMLPRSADEIAKRLQDWLVISEDDQVIGCVSLVFFNDELCEVRSLAVDPAYRGNGYGHMLVRSAIELAQQRDMQRVL